MAELDPTAWLTVEPFPLIGVAVDVRSLYNVGAIFRASDAARVSHLYLVGGTGHPGLHRDRIDKTALGAGDTVPWTYARDPLPVLAGLRARGITVAALELTPVSQPLDAVGLDDYPLALVVGHETAGLSPALLAHCDLALQIPTYGRKPSLNVALAYGVAMLDLARRWAAGTGEPAGNPRRGAAHEPGAA